MPTESQSKSKLDLKIARRGSDARPFGIAYIPPPQSLKHLVTTFYMFRSAETVIEDVQPAGIGHLMFFLKGAGHARFLDGHVDQSHPVSIICPSNAAMYYRVNGPFHCFGCAFTPLGWRALTQVSANHMIDKLISAKEFVTGDCMALLSELQALDSEYSGQLGQDALGQLGQKLLEVAMPKLQSCLHELPPIAIQKVTMISQWLDASLSPKVEDLVAAMGMSDRQVQRIATEYFGCSPKALARKYRALRVAMALTEGELSNQERANLFDLFYDQSHMIREIRHFVGRTPAGLAADETSLLQMWLEPDNIRELRR